jgi:hypothetical protein
LKTVLDKSGVPNQRHVFEGVDHDVNRARSEDCFRLMREWFTQHGVLSAAKDKQ